MPFICLHRVTENQAAIICIDILLNELCIIRNTKGVVTSDIYAKPLTYASEILPVPVFFHWTAILMMEDIF